VPDLRLYRLAFLPALAALVALAFSLHGVPEPIDPGPVATAFDAEAANRLARTIARQYPERTAGSEGDEAVADLVSERFGQIAAGEVLEQRFEAKLDGEERELRNVTLILPGRSDRSMLLLAARDATGGEGATSSAAATGLLAELAVALGTAERQRTVIVASTTASEGALGVRELLEGLPERYEPEAALVITQPGAAEPRPPHVLTDSASRHVPAPELIETVREMLLVQAELEAGLEGAGLQLARLALPSGVGEQAALNGAGLDAVALSSAGRLLPPSELDTRAQLSAETIDAFGRAALASAIALAAAPQELERGPDSYLRLGETIVPGRPLAWLALALLVPPAALVAVQLARAGRARGPALAWAASWAAPGVAALLVLKALALVGLVPTPAYPFDPGTLELGVSEALALALLAAIAAAVVLLGSPAHMPRGLPRPLLGASAGALTLLAALALWAANPYCALLAAPLVHLPLAHAVARPPGRAALAALALLGLVPLALALAAVAGALDWGKSTLWQLTVLVAEGAIGFVQAAALAILAGATVASVLAAGRRQGAARQA